MSAGKRFPFSVFCDYRWKAEHFVGARGVKQGAKQANRDEAHCGTRIAFESKGSTRPSNNAVAPL